MGQQPAHQETGYFTAQAGDIDLAAVREEHHSLLRSKLQARGATPTEAEDILADLWGDCVSHSMERPSLLNKYKGQCPLPAWLATVATNRFLDLKRRQRTAAQARNREATAICEQPMRGGGDDALLALLRVSLQEAFDQRKADELVMLRLVYLHDLSQREVAHIWGCHEATVCRLLDKALNSIRRQTMQRIKRFDSSLDLKWNDFLELCDTYRIAF